METDVALFALEFRQTCLVSLVEARVESACWYREREREIIAVYRAARDLIRPTLWHYIGIHTLSSSASDIYINVATTKISE